VPQPLAIDAPVFHANDQWQYTFTAEEGTTICLSNKNGIIAVVRATGELQSLMLPQMEVGEQFTLTATKKNRFRYEKTITIISSEQSFVYAKAIALNDQDCNGQLDYGEYSALNLELHNAGRYASEGSLVTLLCESPYITLLQNAANYNRIEPDSTVTLSNAFRIQIANDIPDQMPVRFGIRFIPDKLNPSFKSTKNRLLHVSGAVSRHHDGRFRSAGQYAFNAVFNQRPAPKQQQGLEIAHSPRASRRKNQGQDRFTGLFGMHFGFSDHSFTPQAFDRKVRPLLFISYPSLIGL
jgi:hypothetical protein